MFIFALPSGPFETNAYVIGCSKTHEAIIVDPSPNSTEAIKKCLTENSFKPTKIVLTHSHWDHIADVAAVKALYSIPVLIHQEDAGNLEHPGSDGLPCWISFPGVVADQFLKEGDTVRVGDYTFDVIDTPGHTPGGICLYCPETKTLISGDTLFKGSIGNLSFPTARPEKMWDSLDRLSKLPRDTSVYPGHGPSTTIANESWLPKARQYFE